MFNVSVRIQEAVSFFWDLYRRPSGGVLGDEMGLGKTLEVLAFLACLHYTDVLENKLSRVSNGILIVSPATVVKQWVCEAFRWYPPFRCVTLHGKSQQKRKRIATKCNEEGRVLVVSYDTMRTDIVRQADGDLCHLF